MSSTHIVIILFTLTYYPRTDGLRILGLFPLNGRSHFIMSEQLCKALASKGHQVDVYSHFPLKKPFPNYTDFSLDGTMSAVVNNMTFDFLQQLRTGLPVSYMIGEMGGVHCDVMGRPVFQKLFERLKKNQPYDLVIMEIYQSNCYLAWGRHLGIPIIGVMPSALIDWFNEPFGNPHNTAVVPGVWSGLLHPMSFIERLQNTIMINKVNAEYRYYISTQDKYVEKYFGPGYPTINELEKNIDLLLINAHHTLDGIRPYTPSIVPVAGLHIEDSNSKLPEEVQKWLDESEQGCIYITFGSMVRIESFPRHIIHAFYASFKNISPVKILMKIANPEELPPYLPSNVMTQPWFPQVQVLKHKKVRAFVTHGGLMGTQEAMYAGVPLVGIPLFGDQHFNIKSQVRRKVAVSVQVHEITERSLTAAFRKVLNDPEYRQNAEKISREFFDRPMGPKDTAVFWIEYVARHGKKCLRPPILDLPWWKANLIDVYAFILAIVLVAIYVFKFLLCKTLEIYFRIQSLDESVKVKEN